MSYGMLPTPGSCVDAFWHWMVEDFVLSVIDGRTPKIDYRTNGERIADEMQIEQAKNLAATVKLMHRRMDQQHFTPGDVLQDEGFRALLPLPIERFVAEELERKTPITEIVSAIFEASQNLNHPKGALCGVPQCSTCADRLSLESSPLFRWRPPAKPPSPPST